MTRKVLALWFMCVIVYLIILIIGGVWLSENDPKRFDAISKLLPLLIAVPAAWLTACLQKRASFLQNTRDLYSKAVEAVQSAIQFTHLDKPQQQDFALVQKELSTVIELFRGSFKNFKEEKGLYGLFPFEALKTIHAWVSYLGYGEQSNSIARQTVRRNIVVLWRDRLRPSLLSELDRHQPTRFDSPYWRQGATAEAWPHPPEPKKEAPRSLENG